MSDIKETITNGMRFAIGLIVVVVGALMVSDGVLGWVSNESLFFASTDDTFLFWVGFLSIMIGGGFMSFFPRRR